MFGLYRSIVGRSMVAALIILALLVLGAQNSARGQAGSSGGISGLTSQERPLRVWVRPSYQQFGDETRALNQQSVPFGISVPFRERWHFSLRSGAASSGGDRFSTVTALTDSRIALSYAQPVGDGSIVANVMSSLPTGKEELTRSQFRTAEILSQNFYPFTVPSLGQGLGLGTGITGAVPVSESVVAGAGVSYRYRGPYQPVTGRLSDYNPGDEIRSTAGFDIRLNRTSALSAEYSFFWYGTDTAGGERQMSAGNQHTLRMQYLYQSGYRTLRIIGAYSSQGKNSLPAFGTAERTLQIQPTEAFLRGYYSRPLTDETDLIGQFSGRWFGETASFPSQRLGSIVLAVRLTPFEGITFRPQAGYIFGSISGPEAEILLQYEL